MPTMCNKKLHITLLRYKVLDIYYNIMSKQEAANDNTRKNVKGQNVFVPKSLPSETPTYNRSYGRSDDQAGRGGYYRNNDQIGDRGRGYRSHQSGDQDRHGGYRRFQSGEQGDRQSQGFRRFQSGDQGGRGGYRSGDQSGRDSYRSNGRGRGRRDEVPTNADVPSDNIAAPNVHTEGNVQTSEHRRSYVRNDDYRGGRGRGRRDGDNADRQTRPHNYERRDYQGNDRRCFGERRYGGRGRGRRDDRYDHEEKKEPMRIDPAVDFAYTVSGKKISVAPVDTTDCAAVQNVAMPQCEGGCGRSMSGAIHKTCFSCVSNKAKDLPPPPPAPKEKKPVAPKNRDEVPENWEDDSVCSRDMSLEHIIVNSDYSRDMSLEHIIVNNHDIDTVIHEPWE